MSLSDKAHPISFFTGVHLTKADALNKIAYSRPRQCEFCTQKEFFMEFSTHTVKNKEWNGLFFDTWAWCIRSLHFQNVINFRAYGKNSNKIGKKRRTETGEKKWIYMCVWCMCIAHICDKIIIQKFIFEKMFCVRIFSEYINKQIERELGIHTVTHSNLSELWTFEENHTQTSTYTHSLTHFYMHT